MGKTLLELINDKQALAQLAAQQAGNPVQPNTSAQNSSLLGQANTAVQNAIGINTKDLLVKYVGQEPIDKLRVEANFIEKFPGIALKEYGLDAPRILLQRDPHANNKIIKKAAGAVGTVLGVLPWIGKPLQRGLNKVATDLIKPAYPDDWLINPDSEKPRFEGYYDGIYHHTINNGHSVIGNFLTRNRTIGQLKDSIIPTGLAAASGLAFGAVQGVAKLFGGGTTKIGNTTKSKRKKKNKKNNNVTTAPLATTTRNPYLGYNIQPLSTVNNGKTHNNGWYPLFPSQFFAASDFADLADKVMVNGQAQIRRPDGFAFDKYFGKEEMVSVGTVDGIDKIETTNDASLDSLYEKHFNEFLSGYATKYFNKRPKELPKGTRGKVGSLLVPTVDTAGNTTELRLGNSSIHLPIKYIPRGYTSNLAMQLETGGDKDTDNVIGIYSKDTLRVWDDTKQKFSRTIVPEDHLDSVYINYAQQSLHTDFFINQVYGNLGGAMVNSDSSLTSDKGTLKTNTGSYWASYESANGTDFYTTDRYWIKPVRWNTSDAPYSTAFIEGDQKKGNEILDRDYYFASHSVQSQISEVSSSYINPYLSEKRSLLAQTNTDKYDRIKFKIGETILLGTLTGITDNTTPTWTDVKAVGSGFKFYLYDSWEREISFKFQMYAESDTELNMIWEKAEEIKKLTLPTNNGSLGVFGKVIALKIGDIINETYGFLTQANLTVLDNSPWEITDGIQKPFIYEMDITYKVVANSTLPRHYPVSGSMSGYVINTKSNGEKLAPEHTKEAETPDQPKKLNLAERNKALSNQGSYLDSQEFNDRFMLDPNSNFSPLPRATEIGDNTSTNSNENLIGQLMLG